MAQDKLILVNKADPVKVYEALARIIGEKEGIELKVKRIRKKEEQVQPEEDTTSL